MSARARQLVAAPSWQALDHPIIHADCLDALRALPDASIDAVVTDPPYGLGFMGHAWDQPGEFGPVRGNGRPAPFASGRPQAGPHGAGPAAAAARSTQKRASHPAPSGFTAKRGGVPGNGGALEAGRYDLSPSANRRFQAWCEAWASETLRVLKPGGHMLVFGSTRTYHRMAAGIEDAGFEIRDTLCWLFGSGFPKSLNVSKAIDRAAGAEREVVGQRDRYHDGREREQDDGSSLLYEGGRSFSRNGFADVTAPATPEATAWEGWGTALKPAFEPIVVARKPLAARAAGGQLGIEEAIA